MAVPTAQLVSQGATLEARIYLQTVEFYGFAVVSRFWTDGESKGVKP